MFILGEEELQLETPLALIALATMASATQLLATDLCAPPQPQIGVTTGVDRIKVTVGNGVSSSQVNGAMNDWNSKCAAGISIPEFSRSSGDITVHVRLINGPNPYPGGECGSFHYDQGGTNAGGEVRLYTQGNTGGGCSVPHRRNVLRHELGHALSLGQATGTTAAIAS